MLTYRLGMLVDICKCSIFHLAVVLIGVLSSIAIPETNLFWRPYGQSISASRDV